MKPEIRKTDFSKIVSILPFFAEDSHLRELSSLWLIGNADLLKESLLAIFCSTKCPGNVILRTYDFAVELRDHGIPVIGGFQTPVEKECLNILLKGNQPIVICPARNIQNLRIPENWSSAIEKGRLLIVSPFNAKHKRATITTAQFRNRFVAAIAPDLFFLYASAKSKTFNFAHEMVSTGRHVMTFDLAETENLKAVGASTNTMFE